LGLTRDFVAPVPGQATECDRAPLLDSKWPPVELCPSQFLESGPLVVGEHGKTFGFLCRTHGVALTVDFSGLLGATGLFLFGEPPFGVEVSRIT
jgi:hypothetical protein